MSRLFFTASELKAALPAFPETLAGLLAAPIPSPEEAAEEIKLATRRYAKRQLTWFRAQPGIVWLDGGANDLFARAETTVAAWLSDQ